MIRRKAHRQMVRRNNGRVQTAVHQWQRGRDRIVLVGMLHVAEPDFYARVQALADRFVDEHGAEVHYERIGRYPADAVLTERERKILPDPGARSWLDRMAEVTGLAFQGKALTPRERWRNVDVHALEALRAMGPWAARLLFTHPELPDVSAMSAEERERVARRWRSKVAGSWFNGGAVLGSMVLGPKGMRVVEHWRDIKAVNAALEVAHAHPVVMLWGAGHLAGMGDLFRDNGFHLNAVEWLDAL